MFLISQDQDVLYNMDRKSKVYCKAKYYWKGLRRMLIGYNVYGENLMEQGVRIKDREILGTYDDKHGAQAVVEEIQRLYSKGIVEVYTMPEEPDDPDITEGLNLQVYKGGRTF